MFIILRNYNYLLCPILTLLPMKSFFLHVTEEIMLQEDLLKVLPMINEANAMSEELDKKVGVLSCHLDCLS